MPNVHIKKAHLTGTFRAKKQSRQTRVETLERSETRKHVKNVKLKVLI